MTEALARRYMCLFHFRRRARVPAGGCGRSSSAVVLIAQPIIDRDIYRLRVTNVDRPRLVLAAAMAGLLGATLLAAVTLLIGSGTGRAVWLSVAAAPVAAVGWRIYLWRNVSVPALEGGPANRQETDAALRALASGAAPQEARVRELAERIAKQRLSVPRDVIVLMVSVPVMVVGCIGFALIENPVSWWYAGVWMLAGPWLIVRSRRLERQARRFPAAN
jgi:hypothetical protein